jgi:ribA/ribD-fused uncharacterized protein
MSQQRTYKLSDTIIFHKTTAAYGGLSNMAAGYSLNINDVIIPSAEHLYQLCRFPRNPEIQWQIITEPNPMKAKWISRAHNDNTRPDWNQVRYKIMQWVLEVKLSQNWNTFGTLLQKTEDKPIVELTNKDKVWGAKKEGDLLIGINALGRLLMLVRGKYVVANQYQRCVQPLNISDFLFLGHPIDLVCNQEFQEEINWSLSLQHIA